MAKSLGPKRVFWVNLVWIAWFVASAFYLGYREPAFASPLTYMSVMVLPVVGRAGLLWLPAGERPARRVQRVRRAHPDLSALRVGFAARSQLDN